MLTRFKSMKGKLKPTSLKQTDGQGRRAFFNALLKSRTTPTTLMCISFSGYDSTPEPPGHSEPPSLHRHVSTKIIQVPESKYYRTSDGLERELRPSNEATSTPTWPTRTSSIKDSQRYATKYASLIGQEKKDRHSLSSLETAEPYKDSPREDGYDHYCEQRHAVLCNHEFRQQLRSEDGKPFHIPRRNIVVVQEARRPRQDYDWRSPSLRREHATLETWNGQDKLHGPTSATKGENTFDLRRSVLMEPHPAPVPAARSISNYFSVTPSTVGLIPQPLFSQDQPPSKWSHSGSSSEVVESEDFLRFEGSPILRPCGGAADGAPFTPLSPWPHTYPTERPSFKDTTLEEYRLADPGLLRNGALAMPSAPYRHLSWETLTLEDFLMTLGYHALTLGVELPLIYAERPCSRKDWANEEVVAQEAETFNARVEEMCLAELQMFERLDKQDAKLKQDLGFDNEWKR